MGDGQRALMERALGFTSVSDVLLHVGFLGIDHDDEELRGAAYNLLGANHSIRMYVCCITLSDQY
jgi:hypothetical protein